MSNPYHGLPDEAFWRTGVAGATPFDVQSLYRKKWSIAPDCQIATAGSCFAQHIARELRQCGSQVLDVEPAPAELPVAQRTRFGYAMYSARYGNVYTTQQLLQLALEACGEKVPEPVVWQRPDGRFVDALRPAVEPDGLASPDEVLLHRRFHVARVGQLLKQMDLMIFTLGLTESWRHKASGTVYPLAPGVLAGDFDPVQHEFVNFEYGEVHGALDRFRSVLREWREGRPFRMLLTVSPVPLTATASGGHVWAATSYSKAVLRAAAGALAQRHEDIDYFPSYEIINHPQARGVFFDNNMRSVRPEGVATVMRAFFAAHQPAALPAADTAPAAAAAEPAPTDLSAQALQCEEQLLESFRP